MKFFDLSVTCSATLFLQNRISPPLAPTLSTTYSLSICKFLIDFLALTVFRCVSYKNNTSAPTSSVHQEEPSLPQHWPYSDSSSLFFIASDDHPRRMSPISHVWFPYQQPRELS